VCVCVCVCETTERSESFCILKCGKAAQLLPWQEGGDLVFQGHQSPCASERQSPKADSVLHQLSKSALAGGTLVRGLALSAEAKALGKEEQKETPGEQDALSTSIAWRVSPACSSRALVNVTLASALVTASEWFCTQMFWAAVHDKLDGTHLKAQIFRLF